MENIKETIEDINSQIEAKNQEIKESINEKASTESVKNLTGELEKLRDVAKTQGEALATLKTSNETTTPLTFSEALKNAFIDGHDKIKSVKTGAANGTGELTIKEVTSASVKIGRAHV